MVAVALGRIFIMTKANIAAGLALLVALTAQTVRSDSGNPLYWSDTNTDGVEVKLDMSQIGQRVGWAFTI